jgi:hypothetical protein
VKRIPILCGLLVAGCSLALGWGAAGSSGVGSAELISGRSDSTNSLCVRAKRDGYVPERDVCSSALSANVDGGGRPDLVLLYTHPITGAGASLKAYPETLELVRADGRTVRARLKPTTPAPSIVAVGNVNGTAGAELFVATNWISSGPEVLVYSFRSGKLVNAGVKLNMGGDSADRFGFSCVQKPQREIIQRDYSLIGPTIYGRWRLSTYYYAWDRATLRLVKRKRTIHHGLPHGRGITPGPSCGPLPGYR